MKQVNSSVFWPVVGVLVVWLAALTWSSVGSAPTAAERAASGGGPVVAFVHGDSLQRGMAFVQTMQANLQLQLEAREAQLQEDALPLQEEAQELLAYANSGQATEDELEIAQRRMMELEEGLLAMQRAAEQDMVVAEQNMQAVLAQALRRHLDAHAEEEGLDFILNWGLSGEGVLYGSEPWDITGAVLERINNAHPDPLQSQQETPMESPEE
jgi:Skp family chaperone for outer membrane proteins